MEGQRGEGRKKETNEYRKGEKKGNLQEREKGKFRRGKGVDGKSALGLVKGHEQDGRGAGQTKEGLTR